MFHSATVDKAVDDIVLAAKRTVPGCSYASFSRRGEDGGVVTLAATDPEALVLDRLQYEFGGGPGLTALSANEIVSVPDVATEARWPEFASRAAEVVGSVLAAPIPDERRPTDAVGSLNIYGSEPNAFAARSSEAAIVLASHLAVLLAMATTIDQLQYALEARDVIGQAKGILMERERLNPEQAFDVLRRASQRQNRKLRDVAAELTAGTSPSTRRRSDEGLRGIGDGLVRSPFRA